MRSCMLMLLFASASLAADNKAPVTAEMSDETVAITATAYTDSESVAKLLGRDPGFPMIVIDVKFSPRGDNKITLWRDDFTLLSHKDGQRSQPLSPTQLAGRGSIMVSSRGYTPASGIGSGGRGPIWGGGPAGGGRPRRMEDDQMLTDGTGGGKSEAQVRDGSKEKENPLLSTLKEKVLPEKETGEAVTGHLYFLLDGKHKVKDLELIYKPGNGDRIFLSFDKKK